MARNPIMFFHRQCGELGSQKASPYAKPLRRDTAAISTSLRKWPLAPLERRGGPSAGFPRSHGIKSNASRDAPTSSPSLPCLCESRKRETKFATRLHPPSLRSYGGQVVFAPRYARYIADAEINGLVLGYIIHVINGLHAPQKINLLFIAVPDVSGTKVVGLTVHGSEFKIRIACHATGSLPVYARAGLPELG